MFSHVTVGTNDLRRAASFYDAILAPLGLRQRTMSPDGGPEALCWAPADQARPWFFVYCPLDGRPACPANGGMTAFAAVSQQAVLEAYQAGLRNGGSDAGAPGLRLHYAPDYFGAYLRDPDGNKIHIVSRGA